MPYHSKQDQEEISKVANYLDDDERVVKDVPYEKIVSIQRKKGFTSKILISTTGYEIEIILKKTY